MILQGRQFKRHLVTDEFSKLEFHCIHSNELENSRDASGFMNQSSEKKPTKHSLLQHCCCFWFCQRQRWRLVKSRADLTSEAGGCADACLGWAIWSWSAGNFHLVFTRITGLWCFPPSQGRSCISYRHVNGFAMQPLCSGHWLGKPGASVLLTAERPSSTETGPEHHKMRVVCTVLVLLQNWAEGAMLLSVQLDMITQMSCCSSTSAAPSCCSLPLPPLHIRSNKQWWSCDIAGLLLGPQSILLLNARPVAKATFPYPEYHLSSP